MIPNIDPPPPWTPQGWSPNALIQSLQSVEDNMSAAIETLRLANTPAPGYIVTRTFTQAEVVTLQTNPIIIIPAPGAGKTVLLWGAVLSCEITVVFTNNPAMNFRYTGFTENNMAIGFGSSTLGRRLGFGLAMNNSYTAFAPSVLVTGLGIQVGLAANLTGAGTLLDFSLTAIYSLLDTPYPA